MALTAYCELDEVRATLGVNDLEISDHVLNLPVYEMGLVRELNKVSTSLPAAFSTVSNTAEESRTDRAQALFDAVRLFSVYAVARQVGVSLGITAPKDIGDGKATKSRFSDSPYRDTLDRIEQMYAGAKAGVSDALASYSGATSAGASSVPFTYFKAVGRGVDPVTGV